MFKVFVRIYWLSLSIFNRLFGTVVVEQNHSFQWPLEMKLSVFWEAGMSTWWFLTWDIKTGYAMWIIVIPLLYSINKMWWKLNMHLWMPSTFLRNFSLELNFLDKIYDLIIVHKTGMALTFLLCHSIFLLHSFIRLPNFSLSLSFLKFFCFQA